ncbi:MAG: hypothetical protein NVSMB70_04770 [Chamaesiphon sp.]
MKVLVIEDEQYLREDLLETLQCMYFEVIGAENGVVGIQLAIRDLPDLIVCDIMMPELDGYGVLKTLRKTSSTAKIPFIFISAKADKSDMQESMNLGADEYITKPFTIVQLSKAISTQLVKLEKIAQGLQGKPDEL